MFRRDFGLSLFVLFAPIAAVSAQELIVESNHAPPFTVKVEPQVKKQSALPKKQSVVLKQSAVPRQSGVQWEKDLIVGRKAMGKSERPMLLYLTAPACQYCELMKQDTFKQQWIIREINKKYTPVMLNGREHKSIADKLQVRMFPATAVVHPSGKVMEMVQGYKSPAEFVKYLAVAQAKLKIESEQIARRAKPQEKSTSVH